MADAIIVHGGAGAWPHAGAADKARRVNAERGCRAAAAAGWATLRDGGSALDAVEAAVRVLEADETFNAGYGALLNRDGKVEHDAALADGAQRYGGVAAIGGQRHPISVARRLLEHGPHVLLVGEGARRFARKQGFAEEADDALIAPRSLSLWQLGRNEGLGDTVGACACDARGHVATATSTGGIPGKLAGRVGDSAIMGAGLYADDRSLAASATGQGDLILRVGLARTVAELVRAGVASTEACQRALADLAERTGGTAGLIVVDPRGRVAHATSTAQMPWAAIEAGVEVGGIEP